MGTYLDTLPKELRKEIDNMYLRERYRTLPTDIRGLYSPYLAEHYVSFEAPLDPSNNLRPYRIQLGEYVIEGEASLNNLIGFANGTHALSQGIPSPRMTILVPGDDYLSYSNFYDSIARFPRYVYDILVKKIRSYLADLGR